MTGPRNVTCTLRVPLTHQGILAAHLELPMKGGGLLGTAPNIASSGVRPPRWKAVSYVLAPSEPLLLDQMFTCSRTVADGC
jgi:hypothetical protein